MSPGYDPENLHDDACGIDWVLRFSDIVLNPKRPGPLTDLSWDCLRRHAKVDLFLPEREPARGRSVKESAIAFLARWSEAIFCTPLGLSTKEGSYMRKLRLGLAVSALTIGALVALSAQATPHATLPLQDQSAVQQVGCTSPGPRCPLGRAWVCPPRSVCYCAPCGRYYGAPWRYPLRPWRWHY